MLPAALPSDPLRAARAAAGAGGAGGRGGCCQQGARAGSVARRLRGHKQGEQHKGGVESMATQQPSVEEWRAGAAAGAAPRAGGRASRAPRLCRAQSCAQKALPALPAPGRSSPGWQELRPRPEGPRDPHNLPKWPKRGPSRAWHAHGRAF